jgi:hypothetical protein
VPGSAFELTLPDRVEAALAKPAADRTPADLRLLVAQESDLDNAVRQAIEILHENPLLEAQSYPGDLLNTVLSLPADSWAKVRAAWSATHALLDKLDRTLSAIADARSKFMGVAQ